MRNPPLSRHIMLYFSGDVYTNRIVIGVRSYQSTIRRLFVLVNVHEHTVLVILSAAKDLSLST
ncbi:MAG TPA: hypothetical protein VFQ36_16490, partial [Ktedonobacteraceae bacterium]|nr:hypothetical protein [Ktedonobacteraceae bacterium]